MKVQFREIRYGGKIDYVGKAEFCIIEDKYTVYVNNGKIVGKDNDGRIFLTSRKEIKTKNGVAAIAKQVESMVYELVKKNKPVEIGEIEL